MAELSWNAFLFSFSPTALSQRASSIIIYALLGLTQLGTDNLYCN